MPMRMSAVVGVGVVVVSMSAPAAAQPADRPSATLARAIELYERSDYYSAHIELYKVISGETADSPYHRQHAELMIGKTLFHMGYHAAAAAVFDRIQQQKGNRFAPIVAMKWQAGLHRTVPLLVAPALARPPARVLTDPDLDIYRDEIRAARGADALAHSDHAGAATEVAAIKLPSAHFGQAQFILGLSHANRGERAEALAAFARVPVKADDSGWARLGIAQEHLRARDWDAAVEALRYVGDLEIGASEDGRRAAFASSWAQLEKRGKAPRALAPYVWSPLVVASGPEPDLLRAVISFDLCRGKRKALRDALAGLRGDRRVDAELAALAAEHADDEALFLTSRVQPLAVQGKGARLSPRALALARTYVDAPPVRAHLALVARIERELAAHNAADRAWQTTAAAAEVLTELALLHALAQADAGRIARSRLQRLATDIAALRTAATGLSPLPVSIRDAGVLTVRCK